jgi:hypothetical protein
VALSTKKPAGGVAGARDRAMASAQRAVPAVKEAGNAVRRGAEDAAAWARPHVDDATAWAKPRVEDARSWAAPRLERSGKAVQDTIAPAIADAMTSAARAMEVKRSRRRRWAVPAAITMMLAAAASAAAAAIMRRRPAEPVFPPVDPESPADTSADTLTDTMPGESGLPPDPEVNGKPLDS